MSLFFFGEKRPLPRHIFITGASSGIGRALALVYASDGVRLSLSGRNEARLNETARLCRDKGATVSLFLFDVTDEVAARHAITQANTFQPLDLIIANAGISAGSFGHGESETTARAIFDTNIRGVLNTVFPALDIFKSTGGQIAIVSSIAGVTPLAGCPAYSATKACVRFWGQALNARFSPKIRVSVICPGFIKTPLTDANDFPMPFMMPADKAAKIIVNGLIKNKPLITFPFMTALGARLLALLPNGLQLPIIKKMPRKES